ncbi:NUDIX domain-containing protein [Halobellus sp. GM3]|uniref:NUDIX domain-containing protein n=1 Tax=Halobellus sp. GM3 TaxID=3458410 RepID=UPI00403DC63E
MAHVVTCFLRERGKVLLARRSDAVGTYRGRWAGISGYVEGDPSDAERDARRELREEVGLTGAALELVRAGDPLAVDDAEGHFVVHPFLFECGTRAMTPNEELAAVEWVDPTAIIERETVPRLWETWRRVGPTVESVREDRTHGSAWLSVRALEVLRDAAADAETHANATAGEETDRGATDEDATGGGANHEDETWRSIAAVARDLRDARPEMVAIENRINRVLADVRRPSGGAESVVTRAIEAIDAAVDADAEAAETAAALLRGTDATAVATLSRSGTVRAAIESFEPETLLVAESRPEREGVAVAEWAAEETAAAVTLTTEAALPTALASREIDAVLVGADSLLPSGGVANKTGTRVLALAAREYGAPVYAVAAADKTQPAGRANAGRGEAPLTQRSPADAVYDGDADVNVHAPTFEAVPAGLIDGIAAEDGLLDAADVRELAERHAENAEWDAEQEA